MKQTTHRWRCWSKLLVIGWNAPVLLCATLRGTTATNKLAQRLIELAEQQFQGTVVSLELRGLSHDAGDALLGALLPGLAPAARAALHAHTTGNPLFLQVLVETVRQERMLAPSSQGFTLSRSLMALDVPRTLRELVAAQVDRLPAEVRRLAQVAAVIAIAGRTVPLWLLERMVDEPQAVLPRLRALALAHVIEAEASDLGPRYTFRHALYQHAAYDQLLERERQELHRRAGLALHEHQNRQEAPVEALAYHCYEGRSWDLALEYSLAAGQRALQSYANREARRLLRRSLGLARRLGLAREEETARESLGTLYEMTGRYRPARAHLERTLRQSALDDTDLVELETRVRRYRLLAEIAEHIGEYDRGEEEARLGLALAERLHDDVRERLRLHEQLAIILMRRGNLDDAEQVSRAGLALLSLDSPMLHERVALLQLIGIFDLQRGNHHAAIEAFEQCVALVRQVNDALLMSPILRNLGLGYYLIGQRARAQICYKESIDIDERIGNVGGVVIANDNLGLVYILDGDYDRAMMCFQKALRLAQAHKMTQRRANVITNLGTLYFVMNDLDQAETTLLQSYDLFSELGEARSLADCLYQMGDLALARGQSEAALGYGEQTLMYAQQVGSITHEVYGLRVVGEALLALDRLDAAADALYRAQELQSRVDDPFGQVLLLRAAALLAKAKADDEAAARLVRMGLELAESQKVPYLIARMGELIEEIEAIQTEAM